MLYQAEPLPELGVRMRIIGRCLVRFPAWYAPLSVAEPGAALTGAADASQLEPWQEWASFDFQDWFTMTKN